MPNIKSAEKRVLVTEKKTAQNKSAMTALKTQIKKFLASVEAGNKDEATKLYSAVVSSLDSAVADNLIHKNKADNNKAKLAKKLASLNA